jgi:hypothetical protein
VRHDVRGCVGVRLKRDVPREALGGHGKAGQGRARQGLEMGMAQRGRDIEMG